MTPFDKDRPDGEQSVPKPPSNLPANPVTGSLPVEPLPSEKRRLPKADARPAPVLALLRARWPWLVVAGLLGTVAGLALGASPTFQGTAQLQLSGITDSNRVKQVGQTYETLVTSDGVLSLAAKDATIAGVSADELAVKVKGQWIQDTDLVAVQATDPTQKRAAAIALAVANAVLKYEDDRRTARLADIKATYVGLSQSTVFPSTVNGTQSNAEVNRQTQLGQFAAAEQTAAVSQAANVSLASNKATAALAGASRAVSAGLGGIGGLVFGALAALVVGAGRRRLRNPNELRSLAPELNLRATTQAGEVAGRLLESGHSTLVVLSLPSTPSSASRFAAAVANHLRTHGSSVTLVNAIALESTDSSSMALPDEVWVLRRDIRQDVKSYFSTDVLVVACTAEPEAVGLISGQSDLMAVVVAKEGRSTLQQVWDTVTAVETADPIVVLAP